MNTTIVPKTLLVALTCGLTLVAGCGSKTEQAPVETADTTPAAPEAAPPIVPAPAVTQASWAPDALEELLAPIALYPDVLLGQILAASVNSQEVLDGGNWLLQNQDLKGDDLDAAAEKAGFGPAMRALVHFPIVVDMMCQQIDWTRQIGSAFSSDQKSVLDAVQRLRARAAEVGNLKSTPEQKVETTTENEKVIIEVKPANPQVVYVPTYDAQQVYTPVEAIDNDTVSTETAVAAGLFAFGVGILIGSALDDDDYCYPHYGYGAVYYGPRPFYPPAYVYRPVYGPAFRPAYGYASPPGYRYNYNNIDVDRNININSNDYYNRFDDNRNLKGGETRSPLAKTKESGGKRPASTTKQAGNQDRRAQASTANRAESWKGQSTYAGARPATNDSSPGRTIGGSARTDDPQSSRGAHVDRGYGGSTRTANAAPPSFDMPHQAATGTPEARDLRTETMADRGGSDLGRSDEFSGARDGGGYSGAGRNDAFSGANRESGSFERASSARGHASAGSQRASRGGGGRRR
jgi:Protein of unknown function (DUF3300)